MFLKYRDVHDSYLPLPLPLRLSFLNYPVKGKNINSEIFTSYK